MALEVHYKQSCSHTINIKQADDFPMYRYLAPSLSAGTVRTLNRLKRLLSALRSSFVSALSLLRPSVLATHSAKDSPDARLHCSPRFNARGRLLVFRSSVRSFVKFFSDIFRFFPTFFRSFVRSFVRSVFFRHFSFFSDIFQLCSF